MASLDDCKDKEWLQAQAQLWAAQRLPAGNERIEALRMAGMQRWLASKKFIEPEVERS